MFRLKQVALSDTVKNAETNPKFSKKKNIRNLISILLIANLKKDSF